MTDAPSNPDKDIIPSQDKERGKNSRWSNVGLGAAIGSAAIVAALLYVNHTKKK